MTLTFLSQIRRYLQIQEILPLLEQIVKMGKKLVIIAEDVEGEALTTIILNNLRGTFKVAAGQGSRLWRQKKGNAQGYRSSHRRRSYLLRAWS